MGKNLTSGNIFKNVVQFSAPYLLSYFLQTLYGMADLFIVGQYEGVASTTAVSVGSQIMHMITVMLVGLAMGSTVTIGQSVGAGDKKRSSAAVGNSFTLFMGISVVLTLLLLLFRRTIVSIVSTPAEAVDGTVAYLTICFIGIPFITAYNVLSSVFRGLGDSKSPMYFIAIACAVNIGLDYLFIGAMDMGAAGAALGTTLSQAVSVAAALLGMRIRGNGLSVSRNDFRPKKNIVQNLLRVGLPIMLQDGLIQVSFLIITVIVNRRGLNDAAAVGIVEKIISFLFLVPSSMLSTVSALGAQNIGAGKPERAQKTLGYAILLAISYGLVIAVLTQFFAESIVALFTDGTSESGAAVVRLGGTYMRGYIWDCVFAGIHFSFSGYFCACGKSPISFLHNILAIVFVRIPGCYLASVRFPETLFPMGLATSAGSLLSCITCVIAYIIITKKFS